jgi:hypothetical protein
MIHLSDEFSHVLLFCGAAVLPRCSAAVLRFSGLSGLSGLFSWSSLFCWSSLFGSFKELKRPDEPEKPDKLLLYSSVIESLITGDSPTLFFTLK